jgi:hypothetical protein
LQLLFYFSAVKGNVADIDWAKIAVVAVIFEVLVKIKDSHPLGDLRSISIGVEIKPILNDFDRPIFHVWDI